jgi:hypothetical protein
MVAAQGRSALGVDADTELHAPVIGELTVALGELALDLNRAVHGFTAGDSVLAEFHSAVDRHCADKFPGRRRGRDAAGAQSLFRRRIEAHGGRLIDISRE